MEEKTVTIKNFQTSNPFSVIATQNPSDLSGTSLLPESQLDRFAISFSLEELNKDQRIQLLKNLEVKLNTNSDFNFEQNINQIETVNVNDNVIEYLDNISEYIKKL